ncbi:MAG: hypothetical protein AB7K24_13815 [Gemmataceae bacterium]
MFRHILAPFLVLLMAVVGSRAAELPGEWGPPIKHWDAILVVRYSPDGKRLLTASSDGTVATWDANTGRKLRALHGFGRGSINGPCWSGDDKRIFTTTGSNYRTAVWEASSGKHLRTLYGYEYAVSCGCLDSGGAKALLGTQTGKLLLWDTSSGAIERTFSGHTKRVKAVAFSSDDRQALSAAEDKTAILWDVATGKPLKKLMGHKEPIDCVALSRDGKLAITGSSDKSAIVWDLETGTARLTLSDDIDSRVADVGCSDDGKVLLTSDGLKAQLWEAAGKKLLAIKLPFATRSCTLSPDGSRLAAANEKNILIWNTKSGQPVPMTFGTTSAVLSARWAPKGKKLFVGSDDGSAVLWNYDSKGQDLILDGHGGPARTGSWSGDGAKILTGDVGRAAALWDASTGKRLKSFAASLGPIKCVSLSSSADQALLACDDKNADQWDCQQGTKTRALAGGPLLCNVQWSPDDRHILTGAWGANMKIWDGKTGEHQQTLSVHLANFTSARWSPDGTQILACYSSFGESIAYIWDVKSGKRVRTFQGHNNSITCVAWHPDAKQVATASDDHNILIWEAHSGKKLHLLKGHWDNVTDLDWSPDGKWLLTASLDGTARIWNAGSGQEVCRLLRFNAGKDWLVFTPTGAYDGTPAAKNELLYQRPGTTEFVPAEQYLKKPMPGLLSHLLDE